MRNEIVVPERDVYRLWYGTNLNPTAILGINVRVFSVYKCPNSFKYVDDNFDNKNYQI